MNLHLTDHLVCPRCGPRFGLILLAVDSADGRVLKGRLGCPNCREHYPIEEGWVDLRPPPRRALVDSPAPDPAAGAWGDRPLALAALLGVTGGPGNVLLLPGVGVEADGLAPLIPSVEVVITGSRVPPSGDPMHVTRVLLGRPLPFRPMTFRGIVSVDPVDEEEAREILTLVVRGGRWVVMGPAAVVRDRSEELGLRPVFESEEAAVFLL